MISITYICNVTCYFEGFCVSFYSFFWGMVCRKAMKIRALYLVFWNWLVAQQDKNHEWVICVLWETIQLVDYALPFPLVEYFEIMQLQKYWNLWVEDHAPWWKPCIIMPWKNFNCESLTSSFSSFWMAGWYSWKSQNQGRSSAKSKNRTRDRIEEPENCTFLCLHLLSASSLDRESQKLFRLCSPKAIWCCRNTNMMHSS